jgi:hypothetical protein
MTLQRQFLHSLYDPVQGRGPMKEEVTGGPESPRHIRRQSRAVA